jgi:hypothetical protein
MYSKIKHLYSQLQEKSNHSYFLAFFRIFICLLIAQKIFVKWEDIHWLYGTDSFIAHTPSFVLEILGIGTNLVRQNIQVFFILYAIVIILYFFGVGKYVVAFIAFLFTAVFQQLNGILLNGGDNLLTFAMLYLCFTDSYQYFSIKKLAFKSKEIIEISNFISNLAVLSIQIHLCLAYIVSGIFKVHADVWFNGVATYYILNMERFTGTSINSWLTKSSFFVVFTTYFTLFLEVYFPLMVWWKKTRIYFLIGGVLLHLGIAVFMILYDFQLLFIATYGFFISNETWLKVHQKLHLIFSKPKTQENYG